MSNNVVANLGCPPLMSDGRHATDYRPTCYVHDLINKQNGLHNSEQTRHFLMRNADKLIARNRQYFLERAGCNSCSHYHVDPNGHDKYWNNYRARLDELAGLGAHGRK